MSNETEFKPGDLAIIECEGYAGVHMYVRGGEYGDVWSGQDPLRVGENCCHFVSSELGQSAQPVLILRPDDNAGLEALSRAWLATAIHPCDPTEEMRVAVETVIAAQHAPKPLEEPTDLAARVKDASDGEVFAGSGSWWFGNRGNVFASWEKLIEARPGPLEIITPDGDER